ncbi:putative poly(A)-specific ribonuclease [Rosa chinensis]|uniref:Putative poly(A)-specific ribonuclease n=1 Tax=Rosa chinensis TaxID=74649 RepID=A0A2P6P3M8_ROSCH|nr:carbon catabolite repressor protein 4 homolog 5 isoform X2 [Rosa chinensis]PRQ16540.1 putative poly(A)-specific ribonuclease [Rosa chinensis]
MEETINVLRPKRKHSLNTEAEQPEPHKRRRRTVESETEPLTRQPDPSSSNRFRLLSCPSPKKETQSSREWVCNSSTSSAYGEKFVVVSYNILGVENASNHSDMYNNVPPRYMKWKRRRRLIRKEVKSYNASIVCFQEVDRFDDLAHKFRKDGLEGVYKARTGEVSDGCAIFWKQDMFSLLHQESIEFQSFGLRHNVAQFCVLKLQDQLESDVPPDTSMRPCTRSRSLVIGNIHVLFNPSRGDIKLGQVRLFLEKAYKLSLEWGSIPVIIAGDLNSTPQSPIYQFLASSQLDIQRHDRRRVSGQIEFESQYRTFTYNRYGKPFFYRWSAEEVRLATGCEEVTHLQHHLKLGSAYLGVPGSRRTRDRCGEPLATSYHSKFLGTVDYIWHTEELVPVRVLETLPIDTLKGMGGLPSKRCGSDHLALVCELAFRR